MQKPLPLRRLRLWLELWRFKSRITNSSIENGKWSGATWETWRFINPALSGFPDHAQFKLGYRTVTHDISANGFGTVTSHYGNHLVCN